MRLTVDGETDYVKQFASHVEWIENSFAYVGGNALHRPYIPPSSNMFKGCMKEARFKYLA